MLVVPTAADPFLERLHDARIPHTEKEIASNPKLATRLMGMRKIVANATCRSRNSAHRLKRWTPAKLLLYAGI